MIKKCLKVYNMFFDKFDYFPEAPGEVIMEEPDASEEFYEVVKRSIETGIDETIEKYGTDPNYGTRPFNGIYID